MYMITFLKYFLMLILFQKLLQVQSYEYLEI